MNHSISSIMKSI